MAPIDLQKVGALSQWIGVERWGKSLFVSSVLPRFGAVPTGPMPFPLRSADFVVRLVLNARQCFAMSHFLNTAALHEALGFAGLLFKLNQLARGHFTLRWLRAICASLAATKLCRRIWQCGPCFLFSGCTVSRHQGMVRINAFACSLLL